MRIGVFWRLMMLVVLVGAGVQAISRLDNLRAWQPVQREDKSKGNACKSWNATHCLSFGAEQSGAFVAKQPGLWVEKIPVPAIAVANSRGLPQGACKRQLKRYIEELGNGTLWAFQMYDASVKHPYGIIDGQTRHLGSFDQCYGIETYVPDPRLANGAELIKGRYCRVDYRYEQKDVYPAGYHGKLENTFDPNGPAWEAIKEKGDFRRTKRYMLQLGLCVPAACSAADVQSALEAVFDDYGEENDVAVKVSVDEENCQAAGEEPEVTFGTYVYCGIVACIIVLVAVSSLYDSTLVTEEEREGTSRGLKMLLCFSAKRNLRTIFEVNYNHRGLDTIHSIRFFSMCLVMIGHRMVIYYLNPVVNRRYLELTFDIPSFVMVHNGPIIVDGFFAIGGLLTCYGLLDQFDKAKRMNFFGLTLIRFLRFTPAYALVLFFYAYVFKHIGSGPEWRSRIVSESDNCANTWWANLFYLNNYMTMEKLCMFQSWYLAVDFHCYLIAITLTYVFWKCPRRIGYSLLGLITFISILIPFIITYVRRIQPLFIGFPYLYSLTADEYFTNYYTKTHLRMTAYMVGVIAGAIIHDYKDASWRISKRWSQGLFVLLAVVTAIKSQSLGSQYYNPNSKPSPLEVALYASLHRGFFALSFCSIVVLITIGDGLDFHYNILTPRWVQPLGRLTYSVFLCHNILQMYQWGSVRSARTYTIHNAFWDFVPDIVYSFSLALIMAICIEGPFRKLEKHFILKRSNRMSMAKDENANENRINILEAKKID